MPLQDWTLKATFDEAYKSLIESPGPGPITVHYLRAARDGMIARVAGYFAGYLGPAAYNNRFVIVGGGFGWVAGELLDMGFTNIVVTELSTYILDNMDLSDEVDVRDAAEAAGYDRNAPEIDALVARYARPGVPRRRRGGTAADVPIINEDILTSTGRTAIRAAVGGNPQIVVTEDILPGLTDTEAQDMAAACQTFGGQQTVAHLVTTLQPDAVQDTDYNWKTLADWKLLIPSDIFVDAVTGEVLE